MTQREWDIKIDAFIARRVTAAEQRYAQAKRERYLDNLRCSAAYVRSKRVYRDA